ncbi:DUF3667 domain-containing protein [Leeuwenhoekiella marinoflava]|uniref:DUF3667 domain-containing protein n=2 Tax=Leeuwenhoekiella marinoflava TaxID=988 RepID=A0A4Q0PJJ6_9FLAO|nr:DUF3667 domain-containing protein [Leeuwenhoekiella marinoflava]RXG27559.1 putative protein DUF3667 [Leeuwenhoekiella marinoflava]SHF65616.1 Protein of unknown function [Leeuwenhoekiella marinoflava DSM 3653]
MNIEKSENTLVVVNYCRNCSKNLSPHAVFCNYCGGKIIKNRITVKNLLEDFNDRFLSIDGAFPKTFLALFRKPEDVIGGYINGVRKKYMSAFGYFALSLSIAGIYVFILREYFMDSIFESIAFPEEKNQAQLNFIKKFAASFNEYQALTSILSIPVLALISRIVFWNYKQFNYLEHTVIYLYAFSHINLTFYILAILTIWSPKLYYFFSFLGIIGYIIYLCYVLKRLYRLSFYKLIIKTSLFALVGSIFLIIITIIAVVIMAKMGMFDELIESIKAVNEAKN